MTELLHALEIDRDKCRGRLSCMRICPTDAIRVRDGKVQISEALCIDCGECIVACKEGAIKPRTDCWNDVESFPFKVAIVSPTLFGQFPLTVTPAEIVAGLKSIGFDAVYEPSIENELIRLAIQDYLSEYDGPLPLFSSTCPVVVRLIQVSYPDLVGQLIPFEPPRELAGREAKRYYSEKLGIPQSDIGTVYIAPCPAKMVSTRPPGEGPVCLDTSAPELLKISGTDKARSYLDRSIGIHDLYNPLLAAITRLGPTRKSAEGGEPEPIKSPHSLRLALTGGQSHALKDVRYISVSQLPNIIGVIEDIDKGKIKNVEFLECYACTAGCIGGPLTVDDRFVARSKILKIIETMEKEGTNVDEEARRKYVKGDYFLRQPRPVRPVETKPASFVEQIKQVKVKERFEGLLPGIDCGLCGAPRCEVFADDLARCLSEPSACPLLSPERIAELRKVYDLESYESPLDTECGEEPEK
jgi:iron only hydrogenase large subunit-like protein